MEDLHFTLKRNGGRVVGLHDEVSLLYKQLDRYNQSSLDKKTMLSLINGSTWRRNFRKEYSMLDNPWYNMAGFVYLDVLVEAL